MKIEKVTTKFCGWLLYLHPLFWLWMVGIVIAAIFYRIYLNIKYKKWL